MAFTYVTVTHTFETAADVAAGGTVEFLPVAPMHNDLTVVAATITVTLTGAGLLSVRLAANTDPATLPTGTTYQVTERITGQKVLTYFVQIPHDQGSTLDLRALAGWVGGTGTGTGTVTAINGESPDGTGNVVVSAADVGAQLADADLTGLAALGDGVPVRTGGTWAVASGTRDSTRFLRDDGTWQAVGSGGGSVTSVNGATGAVVLTPDSFTDATTNHVFTAADDTKLAGIATGATANDTDANLKARANHTGTQAVSTLTTTGTASSSTFLRGDGVWATPTGASGYTTVQDEGSGVTARASLNFTGRNVTATDNSGSTRTDVTVADTPAVHSVGSSGTALTVDVSATSGPVKTITLTGNCTLTLTAPASGRLWTLDLFLTQDATGSRTVTWPAAVKWAGGAGAPTLSTAAGAKDWVTLSTPDAGTTWYAAVVGKAFA